jgi:hypothetical protein
MRELLEISKNAKKNVTLYVKGQTVTGAVVRVAGDIVELRNKEFSRIIVRIDSVDGVAMA